MKCKFGCIFGVDYGKFIECHDGCQEDNIVEHSLCYARYKQCESKVMFETEDKANTEAIIQTTKDREFGSYKCKWCKGWHIGRKVIRY